MVWNVGEAGPDSREQQLRALATRSRLDTEPDNGEDASRQDNKVAKVVANGIRTSMGKGM